eukprot:gene2196-1363_t
MQLEWTPCDTFSLGGAYLPAHWVVEAVQGTVPPTSTIPAGGDRVDLPRCATHHTLMASYVPPLRPRGKAGENRGSAAALVRLPTRQDEEEQQQQAAAGGQRQCIACRSTIYLTEYVVPLWSAAGCCSSAPERMSREHVEREVRAAYQQEREGLRHHAAVQGVATSSDMSVIILVKEIHASATSSTTTAKQPAGTNHPEASTNMLLHSHQVFLISVWEEERIHLTSPHANGGGRETREGSEHDVSATLFFSTKNSMARTWLHLMLERTAKRYGAATPPPLPHLRHMNHAREGEKDASADTTRSLLFSVAVQLPTSSLSPRPVPPLAETSLSSAPFWFTRLTRLWCGRGRKTPPPPPPSSPDRHGMIDPTRTHLGMLELPVGEMIASPTATSATTTLGSLYDIEQMASEGDTSGSSGGAAAVLKALHLPCLHTLHVPMRTLTSAGPTASPANPTQLLSIGVSALLLPRCGPNACPYSYTAVERCVQRHVAAALEQGVGAPTRDAGRGGNTWMLRPWGDPHSPAVVELPSSAWKERRSSLFALIRHPSSSSSSSSPGGHSTVNESSQEAEEVVGVLRLFAPLLGSHEAVVLVAAVGPPPLSSLPGPGCCGLEQELGRSASAFASRFLSHCTLQLPQAATWSRMSLCNADIETLSPLEGPGARHRFAFYRQGQLVLAVAMPHTTIAQGNEPPPPPRPQQDGVAAVPTPGTSRTTLGSITLFRTFPVQEAGTTLRLAAVCTLLSEGRSAAEYLEYVTSSATLQLEAAGAYVPRQLEAASPPRQDKGAAMQRVLKCQRLSDAALRADVEEERTTEEKGGGAWRLLRPIRPPPFLLSQVAFTGVGSTGAALPPRPAGGKKKKVGLRLDGCAGAWMQVMEVPVRTPPSAPTERMKPLLKPVPDPQQQPAEEKEAPQSRAWGKEERLVLVRECGLGALLVVQVTLPYAIPADVSHPSGTHSRDRDGLKAEIVRWVVNEVFGWIILPFSAFLSFSPLTHIGAGNTNAIQSISLAMEGAATAAALDLICMTFFYFYFYFSFRVH